MFSISSVTVVSAFETLNRRVNLVTRLFFFLSAFLDVLYERHCSIRISTVDWCRRHLIYVHGMREM